MAELPGQNTSLWLATTEETDFPKLEEHNEIFDVVVVGGGIAGTLTAWALNQAGQNTAIVEKDHIVQNTTGNTTAKLTSQHNLVYDFLINKHGEKFAKAFGEANEKAIKDIKNLSEKLGIDCDFESADAYVYTQREDKLDDIKKEVKAAQKLGLPASFEAEVGLPYPIKGAIKFADQAQFHPRKFLLGVAAELRQKEVPIYEQTEALDIEPGSPATLKTSQGEVKAKNIVVASKYPFWRREIFDDATWVKLSYALGVTLKNKDYPMQMYINTEDPVRTMRSHPYKDGRILVFGGESHKLTKDYDKDEHYKNLIDDVGQKFKVDQILYRWIAGDMMPHDKAPYIGAYPGQSNIFVITGFHAWGLAWGMASAEIVRDLITGTENKYTKHFSPARLDK
jgi:glycine/D-amino acid oxidase-like deaminating enzyme